ncbi:hypothetical protein GQ457_08G015220 [Hibiscus cannabinus]
MLVRVSLGLVVLLLSFPPVLLKQQLEQMDGKVEPKKSVLESTTARDSTRIQTLHKRVIEKKNQNVISRLNSNKKQSDQHLKPVVEKTALPESYAAGVPGQLVATLESGVSLGSGEYFIDVFVGTPPKHFSLILDTGSDLNWIQCVLVTIVSSKMARIMILRNRVPLGISNTTGDFALETFTVNLTSPTGNSEFRLVENVMFGCGHWNREETWQLSADGAGGTIVDSGTTLSYFADPTYQIIKEAFVNKTKGYPVIKEFPVLDPCYNVSGVENVELPDFGIQFTDGAVWNFPVENYFIWVEEDVVCFSNLGGHQDRPFDHRELSATELPYPI